MMHLMTRTVDQPLFARIRRNHALEHATIHILSARAPRVTLVGRADRSGFFIYGDLPTETIRSAAEEALDRLRRGERHLAIHPNCGTSLVTSALMAGLSSYFAFLGLKRQGLKERLERLPLALLMTLVALVLARPLGRKVQEDITTLGDPGDMQILEVQKLMDGRGAIHRVLTHSSS
jgi:hypothetical protein